MSLGSIDSNRNTLVEQTAFRHKDSVHKISKRKALDRAEMDYNNLQLRKVIDMPWVNNIHKRGLQSIRNMALKDVMES